jgi:Domain of unknown function (DUF4158)
VGAAGDETSRSQPAGVRGAVGTVRMLGRFLADPTDMPATAVGFVAEQLGIAEPSCIAGYGRREPTQQILAEGQGATAQTNLRWTVAMLLLLLLIANAFGLDAVLGAFLAGVVLRHWAPDDVKPWRQIGRRSLRLLHPGLIRRLGNGSGSTLHREGTWPARSVLRPLACRPWAADAIGVSISTPRPQRLELVFLIATALPLLVALSEIGLETGEMLPENAAALVGAGVLSVLASPRLPSPLTAAWPELVTPVTGSPQRPLRQ